MLVGKDHASGEGSCWWGRIMLALQDDEFCKNMISAQKTFFARNGPVRVRLQHKSQQTICQVAPDLKTKVPRSKKTDLCRDNKEK